jgi:glutamate racemase
MKQPGPIGVFDSGYGGLTVLKELIRHLPDNDFLYLGDNARAPYGNRSFETVYEYTLECVKHLFSRGCRLVILACNTASAKALRTIQQKDLPNIDPELRVLGVIRPTTEIIGNYSKTGHVGIFATTGTVASQSYVVEIEKFFPNIKVHQEACPMWVPLVENGEFSNPGTDYFLQKHISNLMHLSPHIDTILLGCTHYPLLMNDLRRLIPHDIQLLAQGEIVANSLVDYLQRHPEIDNMCSKNERVDFLTTDNAEEFNLKAATFFGQPVKSTHLALHS